MMNATIEFLRDFHDRHPGLTALAFGRGRVRDGGSSYQILADRVRGQSRILDLGCGDGVLLDLLAGAERRLAGIDLSMADLRSARHRPSLAGAVLVRAAAQRLPFPAHAFDACVSHLAFMLMTDLEQVAAELARALRPGGTFAAMVPGEPVGEDALELFIDIARPILIAAHERLPPMGDRRAVQADGFAQVLAAAGLTPVGWDRLTLDLSGPPDAVWTFLSSTYEVADLHPGELADLRARFSTAAEPLRDPTGDLPCRTHLYLGTAEAS